jgi:hypothetical protein
MTAKLIWGRVSLRKSKSKARGKCGRERCARLIYLRFGLGRSHRDEIVEGGEYEFAHCNVKGAGETPAVRKECARLMVDIVPSIAFGHGMPCPY